MNCREADMTLEGFSRDIVPIIGLVSIFLIFWQLRITNKWNKYNFTYNILNSGKLYELEYKVMNLFKAQGIDIVAIKKIDDSILEKIKKDQDLNNSICEYLSFLENFCIGLKHGAVEKNIAYDAISETVVTQWVRYEKYIDWFNEDHDGIYSELENWAKQWGANDQSPSYKTSRKPDA